MAPIIFAFLCGGLLGFFGAAILAVGTEAP